jgi:hypothetical protein
MSAFQTTLMTLGYVVFPTPLADAARRRQAQEGIRNMLREAPELLNPDPDDKTWKPQLGGFAAAGIPTSFHHPFIRWLREVIMSVLLEMDVLPIEGRKLEQVIDRVLYRVLEETPSAESLHRDEAIKALPGDVIFGGWVNLDDTPQYFSCAPGTHKEVGNQNFGFAKIESPEEQAKYRRLMTRVEIPPGHAIVFYERIVHEVLAIKATQTSMRLFLGWRVTDSDQPLFGKQTTLDWLREQAAPLIKSGQKPAQYPSCYTNFPRNFAKLTAWSERTFVPECLYTHTVGGTGKFAGTRWRRVRANMHSLLTYGLPLHKAYEPQEIAVLMPSREWYLYTFDSPTERVAAKLPSPRDWQGYVVSKHVAPSGAAKPPRPEVGVEVPEPFTDGAEWLEPPPLVGCPKCTGKDWRYKVAPARGGKPQMNKCLCRSCGYRWMFS